MVRGMHGDIRNGGNFSILAGTTSEYFGNQKYKELYCWRVDIWEKNSLKTKKKIKEITLLDF